MESTNKNDQKRAHFIHAVEDFFNYLPQELYKQGRLLRNKLSIQFSETGKFEEILSREEDYPSLEFTTWLLDDFGFPEGKERRKLEPHLTLGNFFIFASIFTQNLIHSENLFFDREYIPLVNLLSQEADKHFAHIFSADSKFWEYHRNLWHAYADARLISWENYAGFPEVATEEMVIQRVDLLAPFQLVPIAVAILTGKENNLSKVVTLMGHLHTLRTILTDLTNLPMDLHKGKFTYPILYTYADLELPLSHFSTPEGMILAMRLARTFSKIARDCRKRIALCLAETANLDLVNLGVYFSSLETRINEQINHLPLNFDEASNVFRKNELDVKRIKPSATFVNNHLEKAIGMAKEYLLSDLSFRESWEVHRWGMVDKATVISRFPAGLIIETLCLSGHGLSDQVESFFSYTGENMFSYYDHKSLPHADSDTLGVLLRLYRYSVNKNTNREQLQIPLAWLRSSVEESGRIPVWINRANGIDLVENLPVRLLGEGCGSIEAKLLIGLCEYDWISYKDLIHKSAMQLLRRYLDQGIGITVNYPRPYCLWRINQLLDTLNTKPIEIELQDLIAEAMRIYPQYLAAEANSYRITPQQAAFMILACLDSPAEHRIDDRWVNVLLSNQRSNGSWYGEPLFFVPNQAAYTTWHSSHQLSTVFCYIAVKKFAGTVQ